MHLSLLLGILDSLSNLGLYQKKLEVFITYKSLSTSLSLYPPNTNSLLPKLIVLNRLKLYSYLLKILIITGGILEVQGFYHMYQQLQLHYPKLFE